MFGYRNYLISNTTNYVSSPNYGPYDTKYPSIVSNLNNGNLNGKHPTPASFPIMDTGNDYSSFRQIYKRVGLPYSKDSTKLNRSITCSENVNYKKAINIGKSSLKEGLSNKDYYTNRSYDKNVVASTKKRVRSSGCVPPKKCSSIYNHQFTPSNTFTQSSFF